MRVTARVLIVIGMFALLPATAQAHATLLTSTPEAESVVAQPPRQVVLTFDQSVQPVANGTEVVDQSGKSVTQGTAHTAAGNARQLVIGLLPDLPDGDYTIRWRVVSTDGHIVAGVLAFGVGKGRPAPQAATTESTPIDWSYLIARFAYFTGLLLVIGGIVFRLVVFAPIAERLEPQRRRMADLRESNRANQLFTLATVLMLGGGWVALTVQGSEVAGVSFWEAFDHRGPVGSALQATRFGREFGRGIDITAAFAVVAATIVLLRRRSRVAALALAPVAILLGAWAVVVPGISGHAGDPGHGLLTIIIDAAHVTAAAVWIGGLAQLVWVTPHATRGLTGDEQRRTRTAIVTRFSAIALVSVVVLAVTGGVRALWEVGSVSQVWTTSYGRLLIIKTLLLIALIALGYRNRKGLERFSEIHRRGLIELGLMAALIVAVTVLTNLPPANSPSYAATSAAPPPAGGPATLDLEGGGKLSLWPGTAGPNLVAVRTNGHPKRILVTVRSAGGGQSTAALAPFGDSYAGVLPNVGPGQALITVRAGGSTGTATTPIGPPSTAPVPPPEPTRTGAVAAEEAGSLAVGMQRSGSHTARVILIAPSGLGVPNALVLVDHRLALPCAKTPACYMAAVPAGRSRLAVKVLRPGGSASKAVIDLPAADSPAAPGKLRATARSYRSLKSVQSDQVLASSPTRSVTTTFVSQAPNRVSVNVHGGAQQILIGNTEYIQQPDGSWKKQSLGPGGGSPVPDPFWAPRAIAAHLVSETPGQRVLTLVIPGTRADPASVFFRLWVDPRTNLVQHLRMITAAHFMTQHESKFNSAPPVVAPH